MCWTLPALAGARSADKQAMRINPDRVAPALTWLYGLWVGSIRYEAEPFLAFVEQYLRQGRPVMLAILHEELFALTGYGKRYLHGRVATVASDSRDGEIISKVLERIGYAVARGSSTRGGLKALQQLRKFMDQGRIGVITVDGPRGPRRKPKDGAVYLAQRAGAVLIPLRAECSSAWVFHKSWDHFQVPRPFCRCRIHFGPVLEVPEGKLTPEALARENLRLEQALLDLLPGL